MKFANGLGFRLGLTSPPEVLAAAAQMPTDRFLVEKMITGGVAELLVGVIQDPAHGFVLTLAAGGTLTELLQDSVSLLIPASRDSVLQALTRLKMHKVLIGYRGADAADIPATLAAVDVIQAYVLANATCVEGVEVNPLICTPTRAVAAGGVIREASHD